MLTKQSVSQSCSLPVLMIGKGQEQLFESGPPTQPITSPSNSLSSLMLFYCKLIMVRFLVELVPVE